MVVSPADIRHIVIIHCRRNVHIRCAKASHEEIVATAKYGIRYCGIGRTNSDIQIVIRQTAAVALKPTFKNASEYLVASAKEAVD
jgi:hypothetical protein